jgi:hypothetical protein
LPSRTRTALDGATTAIMNDVTRLVAEVRGETPPEAPYDPARAATSLKDERPAS